MLVVDLGVKSASEIDTTQDQKEDCGDGVEDVEDAAHLRNVSAFVPLRAAAASCCCCWKRLAFCSSVKRCL